MAEIINRLKGEMKTLDTKFAGNPVFEQFEARTHLPKSYGILGAAGVYLLLIFINVGGIGEILSNLIGFVLPAYYSLVALKTTSSKDDSDLLTYWIVFAFLNVIEFWSKAILYWIPFYWFFKTVFLVYIAVPQFGGAKLIYGAFISPIAEKYIHINSAKADEISAKMENVASSAKTTGFSTN